MCFNSFKIFSILANSSSFFYSVFKWTILILKPYWEELFLMIPSLKKKKKSHFSKIWKFRKIIVNTKFHYATEMRVSVVNRKWHWKLHCKPLESASTLPRATTIQIRFKQSKLKLVSRVMRHMCRFIKGCSVIGLGNFYV